MDYFAHSKNKAGKRHLLKDHLALVARLARGFLDDWPAAQEAELAGLLHDFGKYGDRFQARLQGQDQGLDHWSAGAWLALRDYRAIAAALAIQGHHIGLQYLSKDGLRGLDPQRLIQNHPLQLALSHTDLEQLKQRLAADGLSAQPLSTTVCRDSLESTVGRMLDIRMVFSALVDADFIDTEAHFEGDETGKKYRQPGPMLKADQALAILLATTEHLEQQTTALDTVIKVRRALREACLKAAERNPGLFTLTSPTGSGKTLAMLAFALKHAQIYGLHRVIMVVPYLSIIEQTATIYREIFTPHFGQDYVLEHHSLVGGGKETCKTDAEGQAGEGDSAERRRRLLAENWDAPLIVTTSVQMLESLFSNRPLTCRKLHRLARAVILFDEVQTLPSALAVPTLAALSHLAHAYKSTVVFATATQPAFDHLHYRVQEHCPQGWRPREIVPHPPRLFTPMKRANVTWGDLEQPLPWQVLAERLKASKQALCIVNLKRHAKVLWELMQAEQVFHLSTNLCPAHRKDVLNAVRERLKEDLPVVLIATQCIEAGVDVDFPVVFRAYGPLEAIIQAAGRCNREGKLSSLGQIQVFLPEDEGYPKGGGYEQATQVTKMMLRQHGCQGMVLDDPSFITRYYQELYDINKPEAAQKTRQLRDLIKAGAFPEIAREYRLIAEDTLNVLVPYEPYLDHYQELRESADKSGLTREWVRQARALTVSLYRPKPEDPIWDALVAVPLARRRNRAESEWFIYTINDHYHPRLGLIPPNALNVWIA